MKRVTVKTPTTDELYRELLNLLDRKQKDMHTDNDLWDANPSAGRAMKRSEGF